MPTLYGYLKSKLIIIILLFCCSISNAQDLSYLDGMPSPDEVIKKISADDVLNKYTKQIGALSQIRNMVILMSKYSTDIDLTPKERKLISAYMKKIYSLRDQYTNETQKILEGETLRNWQNLISKYENDSELKQQILNELLPDKAKERYEYKYSQTEKREEEIRQGYRDKISLTRENTAIKFNQEELKSAKSRNGNLIIFSGIMLIIIAYVIKFQLKKYEFHHRTDGGVIGFETYRASLWHNSKHGIAKVLYMLGIIAVMAGLFYKMS